MQFLEQCETDSKDDVQGTRKVPCKHVQIEQGFNPGGYAFSRKHKCNSLG